MEDLVGIIENEVIINKMIEKSKVLTSEILIFVFRKLQIGFFLLFCHSDLNILEAVLKELNISFQAAGLYVLMYRLLL